MRILAVDDDPGALRYLIGLLERGHAVVGCSGGAEALAALGKERFDLLLVDLHMPPPDGFEVLQVVQRIPSPPPVVVITAVDTARAALEALRLGARDYLVKPAEPEQVLAAVERIGTEFGEGEPGEQTFGLAGRSPQIRQVRRLIPLLAGSREAVLILGETGTGKELLARALHDHGLRPQGPFVAHNMAATPADLAESVFFGHVHGAFSGAAGDHAGLFEQADGGTLFLDEVDSFPVHLQAKLLRVLESSRVQRVGGTGEREVNVRVLASSATALGELVAQGGFRADLFYRLRQLEVTLPPLRERPEDIPALVRQFLAELAAQADPPCAVGRAAMELLLAHSWPGNCRELRSTLRSAALMAGGGPILPGHLPRGLRCGAKAAPRTGAPSTLRSVEQEHIREIVERVGGNRSRAARLLGIDRGTLARKLRALGVGRKPV